MVEQRDRPTVARLFSPDEFVVGKTLVLSEESAHHLRVVRATLGDTVSLRDGAGNVGTGALTRITRGSASVQVLDTSSVAPLPALHVIAPIADRERMLWLAEKCAELGATTWRPVMWRRSKSVSPRGEGPVFRSKLRSRMIAAMLQSGGAWLPRDYPDATPDRAIAATPSGTRLMLHPDGEPILSTSITEPVTIAVGPEGGIEASELSDMETAGFAPVSLGGLTLRFETAGVAAAAIARAAISLPTNANV